MRRLVLPALVLLALAACREEPTVAEQFNTIVAEVENKGQTYEREAENIIAEEERQRSNEAEALFQENANLLGNTADVNVGVELNSE